MLSGRRTGLAAAVTVMMAGSLPALAQAPAPSFGVERHFHLEPQPLRRAIQRFSKLTGLNVIGDGALPTDVRSGAVMGAMKPEEALARILSGTSIRYEFTGPRTIILMTQSAANANAQAIQLDQIDVNAVGNPTSPMTLPPPYSGGQVARGAQLGLLGNRSVMDTPFSQIAYTSKTIQGQQARKLDDVLANDPSVRVNVPRAYGFDFTFIRGFNVDSAAYGINGLYGIASAFSFSSLAAVERVEVLKGPGTLLTGMPPAGGVGGSINLVTKRAGDEPLTQITNSFVSNGQLGTHLDVGRRFGDRKEFGLRFNGSYRNGEVEIDGQKQELGTAALGLDYRGERVRISADLGYEKNSIDQMSRFTVMGPALTKLPVPPDASKNYMPSWAYWNGEGSFGLLQGEVDITDNVTAYAQGGVVKGSTKYLYSDITVTNLNGNFTGSPRLNSQEREQSAVQAGIRTQFDTAFVHHELNFNAAWSDGQVNIINTTGLAFSSNLYNPRSSATPTISVGPPPKISTTSLSSYGVADTMSIWNKRIQLTVGARKQYVEARNFSATTFLQTSAADASALSPAYAIVVKPWENVSLYANYIEGLEPGGTVGAQFVNAGESFPPYQTKQYEAGIKVDWGTVTTTVSAFEITKPIQLSVPVTPTTNKLTQDGESRNRGIEINAFGTVTEGVRVLGGVMFLDARQMKTQGGTFDGFRTFGVPDLQVNLGAEWDLPFMRGLTVSGRAIHTGSLYADQANTLVVPSWTRYDLGASYTFDAPWNKKPVVLRFAVENVLDTNYWQGTVTNRYVFLGAPRTYLVSTTFNF